MTVLTTMASQTFAGNGTTTSFPCAFRIFQPADISVVSIVTATQVATPLVLGTGYTVTGAGGATGFTVVTMTAPASGTTLIVQRALPYTQPTDFENQGAYYPSMQADVADRLEMQIQQLDADSLQLTQIGGAGTATAWGYDAHGYRIINLGDAILGTDAANLNDVYSAIELSGGGAGGSGTISVNPLLWTFTGDGTTTDITLAGATIDNPLFYDVALAGVLQEPYTQYTIVGDPVNGYALRFVTAPANGVLGWIVLRGYARPYSGPAPITTVSPVLVTVTGNTTIDGTYQNKLVLVNSATPVTLTIAANTGGPNDWKTGGFFSAMQVGTGPVTIAPPPSGTLYPSPSFNPTTRGQNSIISSTCTFVDSGAWAVSGDLQPTVVTPEVHAFTLPCSDEATTNIAVATAVYSFRMPYGLLLTGERATLNVAQASGALLTVDILQNGASIFLTKITIDNTEFSSTTAATPPALVSPSQTVLNDGDLITVNVTQVGTAGARGLKVQLIGQRTS